jgi:AcrR family transcriptional regulator
MSPRPRLGELRQAQLLDAAVAVITERGFHDTRLGDVAAAVGLHASTVLHYASSKRQLLAQALAHAEEGFFDDVEEAMSAVDTAAGKLAVIVRACCAPPGTNASYALWLETWSVARTNPELGTIRLQLDVRWRAMVEDVVRLGRSTGEFAGPPPDVAALAISALLDGLAVPMTLGNPAVTPARMEAVALDTISQLLGADLRAPAVVGIS